jgi:3D (Asp-Asp-Asp) domain-containing protein
VHSDGVSFAHSTLDTTVGQALASAAIRVGANDIVAPALDSPIFPGLDIYVTRAKPVRIIFEGRERLVYTHAPTVRDLLLEHGIQPQHTDRIFPALDDPVRKGMTVSFVSFRDGIEVIEERLPYSTVYQDDPDLLAGEERLVAAGVEGFIRREYRITRLNGAEAARELVGEITFPATDEVIAVGTGSPTTPPPLPILTMDGFICSRIISVYATYYTADSAGGGGVTATGTGVYRGIVAVDPAFIPLGTRMWVPGYGHGLAADTGGSITGNIIDLGYGPNDPIDWIPHYLDICILL